LIYKPQKEGISHLNTELTSLQNKTLELKAQIPDIERENRLLKREQRSLDALKDELGYLESQLPQQDSLPGLLGQLITQSKGYALDFLLIKPVTNEEKVEYNQLNIEMQFLSNYTSLINYLNRLEQTFPFIKTQSIMIEEKKEAIGPSLNITMVLSTLLSKYSESKKETVQLPEKDIKQVIIKKNPFTSEYIQRSDKDQRTDFSLTGIISEGKSPTAIINDEVFREGDFVNNSKILEINPSGVLLQEGVETFILTIEE